jgi:hypothetical protein
MSLPRTESKHISDGSEEPYYFTQPVSPVTLKANTVVSEELPATVFRVKVCRSRNLLSCIGRVQGRWSQKPTGGGKEMDRV